MIVYVTLVKMMELVLMALKITLANVQRILMGETVKFILVDALKII